MPSVGDSFVGRRAELSQLGRAIEAARTGCGSVWFVAGTAGLGKSRFAEEAARLASGRGAIPLWGRCWEAGGAPAYWPWVQVLRTLLRGRTQESVAQSERRRNLAQLMPELSEAGAAVAPSDPQTARFALMDAVTSTLASACAETPLLILLEDLHAADPASIMLLDFVARQIDGNSMVILATYRPAEAQRSDVADLLRRLTLASNTIHLSPLDRGEIEEIAAHLLERTPEQRVVEALTHATSGNPLFVVEMCRWSLAKRSERNDDAALNVPPNLRAAIRERIATLPANTVRLLEAAAVIGQEFRAALVASVVDQPLREVTQGLLEAVDRDVLIETLPGQLRFSHILVRDAIHLGLDEQRSQLLHERAGDALAAESIELGPASQVAHHYLLAGVQAKPRAREAAERAARQATLQLAFDDAAEWYRRALETLTPAHSSSGSEASRTARDARERIVECGLLLGLGSSAIAAGQTAAGKQACLDAAALARTLCDAELLAQAALTYGREFEFGIVDAQLLELLEEALAALPEDESGTRAKLLARLAAALQPSPEPERPIAMALLAVEMARRTASSEQLLWTLRSAGSALMDYAPPEQRIGVNREHALLAERLDDRVEALRAETRLVFDFFEMGDIESTTESIRACETKAEQIGYGHFRWRARALSAMWAIWRGDFAEATRLQTEARTLAQDAGDPNGPRSLTLQSFGIARLRGEGDIQQLRSELDRSASGSEMLQLLGTALPATLAIHLGRDRTAWETDLARSGEQVVKLRDPWLIDLFSDVAHLLDKTTVSALYQTLSRWQVTYLHGGLAAMTLCAPTAVALGKLANSLGEYDMAEAHLRSALATLQHGQSPPHLAWTSYTLAALLCERSRAAEEAEQLAAVAASIAERCDMPGLSQRSRLLQLKLEAAGLRPSVASTTPATSAVAPPSPAAPSSGEAIGPSQRPSPNIELIREGEIWSLRSGQQRFRLKDTKGLRWLSRLLAEPGREFHVLDLASEGEAVDGGDHGAILDAVARRQYTERIEALRSEREEAQGFNDQERAHRAQAELEELAQQLAAGLGIGGRERRSGSALEKARINVQRRLKDAVRRIATQDAALARYLERSLQTGTYCSYQPE